MEPDLSSSVVDTRHGSIITTLRPPELEAMIREKDALLGPATAGGLLVVGFMKLPDLGSRPC